MWDKAKIERYHKVEQLSKRGATAGERQAAKAAMSRMLEANGPLPPTSKNRADDAVRRFEERRAARRRSHSGIWVDEAAEEAESLWQEIMKKWRFERPGTRPRPFVFNTTDHGSDVMQYIFFTFGESTKKDGGDEGGEGEDDK